MNNQQQAPPQYQPPAYGDAQGYTSTSYPDDKKATPSFDAPPPSGSVASSSTAPQDLSIHGGGQPITLHVYRDKSSKLSNDDVIMADDKVTPLYYFSHPPKWSGKWDSTFCRSAKDGPPICSITKSAYKDTKTFKMSDDGYEFVLKKPKLWSRTHEYITKDGIRWEWKADSAMSYDLTLRRYLSDGRQQEVAKWDQANWAPIKDGKIFCNALYKDDLDLIVATAVAMEEWQLEQNRNLPIGASSAAAGNAAAVAAAT